MLCQIKAMFACDDCGTEFTIEIDPPYEPPARWSMFDVAEDFIRRGGNYEDGTEVVGGFGSVDGDGRHYCDRCSGRKAT